MTLSRQAFCCAKNEAPIIVGNQHKVKLNFLNAVIKLSNHRMIFNQTSATSSQMCVDLASPNEYIDISNKETANAYYFNSK